MADPKLVALGEERRKEIVRFIRATQKEWGVSPSHQEIAEHLGIAEPAVRKHIAILIEQGLVTQLQGVNRSLRIVPPSKRPRKAS
jgi:predicted ArsR family transcriptional regulator